MDLPEEAQRLTIYVGETDKHHHQPLYEAVVMKAREMQLAGASVTRGTMGFGASSRIHCAKLVELSMDLPVVIEIIDAEPKINAFLPVLKEMLSGGLVTLEKIQVVHYSPKS